MNDSNKMAEAFAQQYSYNIQLDVSLRDLETTKKLSNDSCIKSLNQQPFSEDKS